MRRLPLLAGMSVVLFLSLPLLAQEPEKPQPPAEETEVQAIRRMLEQQSQKIETLTQQIAKLSQLIEASHARSAVPASTPIIPPVAPAHEAAPGSTPSAHMLDPSRPRIETGDFGTTHVVAKGETLTSIARKYNITIPELQRMNKIENDRMLQIGQTLIIPKQPDAAKKEMP